MSQACNKVGEKAHRAGVTIAFRGNGFQVAYVPKKGAGLQKKVSPTIVIRRKAKILSP